MRNWAISVGQLFGVDIRVHVSFLFLLIFVLVSDASPGTMPSLGRGLALVGIVFASVLFHEAGHGLAALHAKIPLRGLILLPLGGLPIAEDAQHNRPGVVREITMALAGPLASLLVTFVCAAFVLGLVPEARLGTQPLVTSSNLLRSVVWVNLTLALVNLLPAYPLDGGRLLRLALSRRMDPVRATRSAVTVGQGFAMVFFFAGIWNTWFMMIGFILFLGAQLEERAAVFQSVMQSVRLEDVMLTDFSTLSPSDTLEDALHKAVHSLQDDFPVVRGGDMVGVISRQKILDALRDEGNGYVQSVMSRVFLVSQRKESLATAFRNITSQGSTLIPVVDEQRLVGIVTLQNLMHNLTLLAESRRLKQEEG